MASSLRQQLPPSALEWMVQTAPTVVAIDLSPALCSSLARRGHRVIVSHRQAKIAQTIRQRNDPGTLVFCAQADALPVQPCSAQAIIMPPHLSPRIDRSQLARQLTRALDSDGWICGWNVSRDDSVPWVKRLQALMQSIDPQAMRSHSCEDHPMASSKYFPHSEYKTFRLWSDINSADLLERIGSQPALLRLEEDQRRDIIAQAQALLAQSAGYSQLRLPYQLICWRAKVNHHELTQPIILTDGGLTIPI